MSEPMKKPGHVPESYSPKKRPEIVSLAEKQAAKKENSAMQAEIKAAPATIKAKARNAVRIIELPACKMVTSGRAKWDEAFEPDGPFTRFHDWFVAYEKSRADTFYTRDFMWGEGDWVEWGYVVTQAPANLPEGLAVIDFPGGLFAVAVSVDGDGKNHDKVHNGIKKWIENSGCFALDATNHRFCMGHITTPPGAKDIMGYEQMDLYFPIRVKEVSQ